MLKNWIDSMEEKFQKMYTWLSTSRYNIERKTILLKIIIKVELKHANFNCETVLAKKTKDCNFFLICKNRAQKRI